jgi:hypothetical protein
MSSNNNIIYVPVSLGEAIDKLTILDIKSVKITDYRINDVKNEYNLLHDKLEEFIIKYDGLYKSMKKVNMLIWNMMDSLRDGEISNEEYLDKCKECIEYNDIRFRIKNKINYVSNSYLKEQKSYKINRLIIKIEKDITDDLILLEIIKYASFVYDEINIISVFKLTYLKEFFHYDITILFKPYNSVDLYKNIVVIEDREYNKYELYTLFDINENELNKII